jgi:hypothetical protein
MASLSLNSVLSGLAELGSVAIFVAMVLVWADALPIF